MSMSLHTALAHVFLDSTGRVDVRIRRSWRIHGNSIFFRNIAEAIHLHQTVTTLNRDWTEELQIEIAPLNKLLWVAVCLTAFATVFCRGSHRGDALVGGRPLDLAFPIAYITRLWEHLQRRNYDSIHVGVLRSLRGSARSRSGRQVVLFDFRNPTAEDNQLYDSIVKLALEADEAQPID